MKRLLLGLLVVFAVSARAAALSGAYENGGSMVGPDSPEATGTISFQGLLQLQFDYKLTRAQHAQVERVVVKQGDTFFDIVCKDRDGAVTWSGRWEFNKDCSLEHDRTKLLLRSRRYPDDGFAFLLNTTADGQILLVEVQRINTTWFGPVTKPVGTFLFNRLAGR